jgi:DNA repair protein RadC
MKVELTTKAEIIEAVNSGKDVYCEGGGYKVIKDSKGQFLIKSNINGRCIGLSGDEGTEYENVLNGTDFYVEVTENAVVAETASEYKLTKVKSDFERVKITSSIESADYIRKFYSDDIGIFESCFILLLDRSNHTIGYAKISQGGISGTVVDVRIIAKYAIDSLCSAVILAHNHPSGNLRPSDGDKRITKQALEGLKLLNVELLDHVILTESSHYSFADSGDLLAY